MTDITCVTSSFDNVSSLNDLYTFGIENASVDLTPETQKPAGDLGKFPSPPSDMMYVRGLPSVDDSPTIVRALYVPSLSLAEKSRSSINSNCTPSSDSRMLPSRIVGRADAWGAYVEPTCSAGTSMAHVTETTAGDAPVIGTPDERRCRCMFFVSTAVSASSSLN